MKCGMAACAAVLAGMWAQPGEGALILPRAGQIGIGIQGQFGTLLSAGELGDAFGSGGGYAVRVRYRMRYGRAFSLSFENQNFDATVDSQADTAFRSLRLITSGIELSQFSDPRQPAQRYLCAGVGIFQSSVKQVDGEIYYFPNPDGFYASLGAGLERFFFRSWAYELGARYLALFHEGSVNHDLQASAGIIFYASY